MDRADPSENTAVSCFRNSMESAPAETTDEGLFFAEGILKRRVSKTQKLLSLTPAFFFRLQMSVRACSLRKDTLFPIVDGELLQ